MLISCGSAENKPAEATTPAATDLSKIKTEIQALETAFAAADNARDAKTISEFYAEDAVTLPNNKSMINGRANILADLEASLATREKGSTISFDVLDVYGDENTITEVGKTTGKDSTGKISYTGKYMAIWQKRDGKYVCIRDISNEDAPAKKIE